MEWVDNHIEVTPPKKPLKLTGTRFATVLGLNHWSTPFEIWCEITRTYRKPFEDTIYTAAGKVIEPKQADYMEKSYFMTNIVRPADIWGEDYFKKTYGDFFHDESVFGGMWDYLLTDKDGKPSTVLEMKTTKRIEDWQSDVPEYYALQAALYAYLLGVDSVIMVASFLEDKDYENPNNFVPNTSNTITIKFSLGDRYPNFEEKYVKPALRWWNDHVLTGVSPDFDEKKDAEILKILRTKTVDICREDKESLLAEAEELKAEIDAHASAVADKKKRYEAIVESLKRDCMNDFTPGTKAVEIAGKRLKWTISKSESVGLDDNALKADGLFEKYNTKIKTTFTVRVTEI